MEQFMQIEDRLIVIMAKGGREVEGDEDSLILNEHSMNLNKGNLRCYAKLPIG